MSTSKAEGESFAVPLGTRVGGRFSIQALLGRGGMADVYRVRDEASGEELALKRLRSGSGRDQRPLSLFEREYHTLAQITHPCIVRVRDYGVDEQGAYYTMELVRGEDLRTRGRLEWREACRVLRDIASALAALHARRWLHRDLSPRNVMCTEQGTAKLIDFGAMAPMGVARALVGTPPLVPPEAVQQQSLDARADLYALGALAYWVLTGRHAYPARDFDELRDLWRSVPRAIERLSPGVPPEVAKLVMELLNLERSTRPSSASEVIERLTSLLGDAAEARPDTFVAYLPTPRLVGRDRTLHGARTCLLDALRGRGAVLLIEGEPGSGRSRLLDACVLEAKLLGAVVLRGDASDAARGDYGLSAALGEQLFHACPELAIDCARFRGDLLSSVVPALAEQPQVEGGRSSAERRHVQTALRDWFLAVARTRRMVIAVDDFERIDEPSAAFIASLAHRSQRRKLVVVAAAARDSAGEPALDLLRSMALRLETAALTQEQTEALLASLFGDARGLATVALRVFEIARGNPRHTMELAEHLVRRGLARYAAGTWILPDELGAEELPASLEAALALGLTELDADARELAEALALTDPQLLPQSALPLLLPGGEPARAYRALDQLVAAGILQAEGERYRFAQARAHVLLEAQLAPERRRELHARLVPAVEAEAAASRLAHHLLHSGEERRAIEVLLAYRAGGAQEHTEALIALLEQALSAADRLGLPKRKKLELRLWLTVISGPLGRLESFRRHGPDVLAELERAAGLVHYRALAEDCPADERLKLALARAQADHDALAPEQRAWSPLEAISELARIVATFAAVAGTAFDLELVEQLPSIEPLAPLSPAVEVVQRLVESIRHHQSGRFEAAHRMQCSILERIQQPDRAGLDASTHRRMRCGILYSLGILEAMSGKAVALERVSGLRDEPGYRANAWRVHVIYHLLQGDLEEARRTERRAGLMHLQDGGGQIFPGTGLYSLVIVQWLADDLDGLKQWIDPMRAMAERFPGWVVPHRLTMSHYLRLKGDLQGALAIAEPLEQEVAAGRHLASCWVAATYVSLLAAVGRADEAVAYGLAYLEACRAQDLTTDDSAIAARATAEALAAAGRHAEAARLADDVIARLEAERVHGLRIGAWFETRARIALAMQDGPAFDRWSERCGEEYTRGGYPALCAKYGRLLQQARRAAVPFASQPPRRETEAERERDALHATVYSRMGECVDAVERAHCALLMLMEHTHARAGHFYALIEGRLVHRVSEPEDQTRADLAPLLEPAIEAELRATETTAVRGLSSPPPRASQRPPDLGALRVVVLAATREGETVVAAAAALAAGAYYQKPTTALLQALAASLLDHDDVDPLTRLV